MVERPILKCDVERPNVSADVRAVFNNRSPLHIIKVERHVGIVQNQVLAQKSHSHHCRPAIRYVI
jgi:hypothetical protein